VALTTSVRAHELLEAGLLCDRRSARVILKEQLYESHSTGAALLYRGEFGAIPSFVSHLFSFSKSTFSIGVAFDLLKNGKLQRLETADHW